MNIKKIISIITCGCFIFTFVLSQPLHASLEKNKEISQDEQKRAMDRLQKLTDSFIDSAEQAKQSKEKELLEV